ncbi:hypothetical protein Tco_1447322 [Tanacetum coccineum]
MGTWQQCPAIAKRLISGWQGMALFRSYIFTEEDRIDLVFLPKEPSLDFGIDSPYISVNMEPLKANEELEIQPVEVTADYEGSPKPELFVVHLGSVAARIKDRKCKTRGGSSRPLIKRKLIPGSFTSRATRAKTSSSKDDVTFLTVSNDEDGFLDVLELKETLDCHSKISMLLSSSWKEIIWIHHMDFEEKAREEECEGIRVKFEAAMTEFEMNPAMVALREKISILSTKSKVTSLEAEKARLEAFKVTLRKEVEAHKQDRREVVSKVVPYAVVELVHSDDMGSLVGKLVSSAIVYGRCRAFEQITNMKEPFELLKVKGYRSSYKKDHTQASNDLATTTFPWLDEFVADPSAPIEALLSKKPPTL